MPECLGRGCNYDCGNCVSINNKSHPHPIPMGDEDEDD